MARQQKDFTPDYASQLKDAGAVTTTAADQVGGSNQILDLGAARQDLRVVVDVSAMDISSGDEGYDIRVEGSNNSDFSASVNLLGMLKLGKASVTLNTADSVIGRYEIQFCNEQNGVTYRYLRTKHVVVGTTPSINYTALLVKKA